MGKRYGFDQRSTALIDFNCPLGARDCNAPIGAGANGTYRKCDSLGGRLNGELDWVSSSNIGRQ